MNDRDFATIAATTDRLMAASVAEQSRALSELYNGLSALRRGVLLKTAVIYADLEATLPSSLPSAPPAGPALRVLTFQRTHPPDETTALIATIRRLAVNHPDVVRDLKAMADRMLERFERESRTC